MTRHKRPPATVRAVGRLIVCSHVECGDPRSGAVVGPGGRRQVRGGSDRLARSHPPNARTRRPPGGDPLASKGPGDAWLAGRILRAPSVRFFEKPWRNS